MAGAATGGGRPGARRDPGAGAGAPRRVLIPVDGSTVGANGEAGGAGGPVLGLDLGDARIGVALSDPDRRLAVPAGTIRRAAAG